MQDSYDFCLTENVRVGSKAPEPVRTQQPRMPATRVSPGPLRLEFLCLGVELKLAIRLGVDLSIVPRYG